MTPFHRWKVFADQARYTLNGWRFDDLKACIHQAHHAASLRSDGQALLAMDTLRRLGASPARPRRALLSAMPPARTGVATCNLKTLMEAAVPVDVFSTWPDLAAYAAFEHQTGDGLEGFPAAALPLAAVRRQYGQVTVSIGNSDEDVPVVDAASALAVLSDRVLLTLHVHDACLWNVVDRLGAQRGTGLAALVEAAYPDADLATLRPLLQSEPARWKRIERLVAHGLMGVRCILQWFPAARVVVNSRAAQGLVSRDLAGGPAQPELLVGHHPLFQSDARRRRDPGERSNPLVVGSFGIPSLKKGLSVLFDACRALQSAGTANRVVVAGFGWDEFLRKHPGLVEGLEVDVHSDVPEAQLQHLMEGVHVAVQLRLQNLGESSGVIASLAMKRVPLVVTGTGAFLDYEPVARLVDANCSAGELADAIRAAVAAPCREDMGRSRFIQDRSPAELLRIWFP